jgi:hypothetical protein
MFLFDSSFFKKRKKTRRRNTKEEEEVKTKEKALGKQEKVRIRYQPRLICIEIYVYYNIDLQVWVRFSR